MPITPAKLQLKNFLYTDIEFHASNNPDGVQELTMEHLDFVSTIRSETKELKEVVMTLRVFVTPEAVAKNVVYGFSLEIAGFFQLPDEVVDTYFSDELIRKSMIGNFTAILWGSLREMLFILSSRSVYGPIILGTATFNNLSQVPDNLSKPKTQQRPKKNTRKLHATSKSKQN